MKFSISTKVWVAPTILRRAGTLRWLLSYLDRGHTSDVALPGLAFAPIVTSHSPLAMSDGLRAICTKRSRYL
ncbi:MAG: hypothetical protein ACYC1I_00630 [Acidimicrobiales bacterium]